MCPCTVRESLLLFINSDDFVDGFFAVQISACFRWRCHIELECVRLEKFCMFSLTIFFAVLLFTWMVNIVSHIAGWKKIAISVAAFHGWS